jgi:hypothetical protein
MIVTTLQNIVLMIVTACTLEHIATQITARTKCCDYDCTLEYIVMAAVMQLHLDTHAIDQNTD